jgi:CMP-N-acetylneuraminic acid synthetase
MYKVNALVPMKGHSERVPNKNLRLFNGKPLCYWVIKALSEATYVGNIYVNTDSEKIANYVESTFEKCISIKRPSNICGDFVSMNDIIKHDLNLIEGEHFIQTHSTNPLLTSVSIDKGIETYFENIERFDSLFSVTPHYGRYFLSDLTPINHNPNELKRTQDLDPVLEENSNFYIFSKESFKNSGNKRIGISPTYVNVNKLEAIDIDEEEDFLLSEAVFKHHQVKVLS